MALEEYRRKRNFALTAEPKGNGAVKAGRRFVIQKHDATRLHYDFRLELGRTLVSWAVPKGIPMIKGERRLAVKVEDHPVSYIDFEGTIPKGQYGGGTVQVWDYGSYEPLSTTPKKDLAGGKLHVVLKGEKLSGEWYLVRLRDEEQWLLIRGGEDHAKLGKKAELTSALSGKTMEQLSKGDRVLNSSRMSEDKAAPGRKLAFRKKPARPPMKGKFIEPMKAKATEMAPEGDWLYEIKFDGFRAVAHKEKTAVHLLSRTNHDLALKFPEITSALEELQAREAVVDGEIVALDKDGRSSFQLLQAYELGQERPPLCFYAFDLLALDGRSMRDLPLEERREKLEKIMPASSDMVRYSASLGSDAKRLLKKAAALGLEGLIGKRAASHYEAGRRSGAWIKLKLVRQQEFVIGGFTEPTGTRSHIGALLVGVHEKGKLVYSGKVGTGFNETMLRDLFARFKSIAARTCPFSDLPEERQGRYGQGITASVMKKCHWVKPVLVCQIKFAEWTKDSRLRQPVYLGLRDDKAPTKVIREPSGVSA